MAKILILIIGHLCNAPRPQKEAETLAKAGYDVTVGGIWFDSEFARRDRLLMKDKQWRFFPIVDFQPHNRWRNLQVRLQGKIAKEVYKRFQVFSPELLGYGARAMLKVARDTRADLTIVHSEVGLWVGNQLLDKGFRVGVDFEDWFSEDLLPEARVTRPIKQMKKYEGRLARECQYCLTTSHIMAEKIAEAYDAPQPTVIYNTFPWADREFIDGKALDRKNLDLPSLHWFSQTIGPGRGLETLFSALNHLKTPLEIHLRGNCSDSYRSSLKSLIPKERLNNIFFHPTVSNAQLISRIAEHDIGLALELKDVQSRDLTVTNKLFQYLHGGLTIVATDTLGQKEILSKYPTIGSLLPSNNPIALANVLENLLQFSHKLNMAKNDALNTFKEKLCWERQEGALLNQVKIALK